MTPEERARRALKGRLENTASSVTYARIAREIREAVAEEREICATYAAATPHIADAIRARGKP